MPDYTKSWGDKESQKQQTDRRRGSKTLVRQDSSDVWNRKMRKNPEGRFNARGSPGSSRTEGGTADSLDRS